MEGDEFDSMPSCQQCLRDNNCVIKTTPLTTCSNKPRPCCRHSFTRLSSSRFAPPMTDNEVVQSRQSGIPQATQRDTKYYLSVWEVWRKQRHHVCKTSIPELNTRSTTQLSMWLTRFVLEARRKESNVYRPNTFHHLIAGLMWHFRQSRRVIADMHHSQISMFLSTQK